MRPCFFTTWLTVASASPLASELVAGRVDSTDKHLVRADSCRSLLEFKLKSVENGKYGVYVSKDVSVEFTTTSAAASVWSLDSNRVLFLSGQSEVYGTIPTPDEFTGRVKPVDLRKGNPLDEIPLTCGLAPQPGGSCKLQCSVMTRSKPQTAQISYNRTYLYNTSGQQLWLGHPPFENNLFMMTTILAEPA